MTRRASGCGGRALALVVAGFAALAAGAAPATADLSPCAEQSRAMRVPPRAAQAPDARAFVRAIADLDERARERAIEAELRAGNVPWLLRTLVPASWTAERADGVPARVTVCVTPDYLAVGSDAAPLRVPLGRDAALAVAHAFGMSLPTTRIVDAVWREAGVRLTPQPLPPDDRMRSTATLVRHEVLVQAQLAAAGRHAGVLTAGHKKDLVLSARLLAQPDRVAIYGWHRAGGQPIQSLSTVHGARYADYSHGVRLVAPVAWIDGVARPLAELLADPLQAPLLSAEGPLPDVAAALGAVTLAAR